MLSEELLPRKILPGPMWQKNRAVHFKYTPPDDPQDTHVYTRIYTCMTTPNNNKDESQTVRLGAQRPPYNLLLVPRTQQSSKWRLSGPSLRTPSSSYNLTPTHFPGSPTSATDHNPVTQGHLIFTNIVTEWPSRYTLCPRANSYVSYWILSWL